MAFYPFEVSTPHIIYAAMGGFIVLFGMFSLLLRERLYIGEAIWAFLFGVIIGPYCANIFNPRAWGGGSEEVTNAITLEFTRIVLAIGVFAVGVELPKAYMAKHWKSLLFLLVPVMTWGWFVSAGLIYALIPGLNFLSSLTVAACLTPTDPILAAAVVGGKWASKHVPAHIRHLLAAESGCNDGAAFPFLFLSLYLIIERDVGRAVKSWVLYLWLYQVILGCFIGGLLGFGFRHLMKFCQRHDLIDRQSYVAQYISLAVLAMGLTTLLGSDDLLAAFSCGVAFAWDGFFNKQTEEAVFSSVIDTLFNIAAFVFVGAWMPFNKFQDKLLTLEVWRLLVIALLVLLLRRLPIIIALYRWIPDIKTFREAVFSGHFGPIGIGAIFISTLATHVLHNSLEGASSHETELTQTELLMQTIQPIVAFMVLCSIIIHGLSIPSFSLGRRVHSVSRTWSRRDTMNSGVRTPEWANLARLVTRREDIVINRDIDNRPAEPDLEKGDVGTNETQESNMSFEKKIMSMLGAEGGQQQVDSPIDQQDERRARKRTSTFDTRESIPQQRTSLRTIPSVWRSTDGNEREEPPDGTEILAEWQEGDYRVIERRLGPGDDVDVTVVHENPSALDAFLPRRRWSGKLHEIEKGTDELGSEIREMIRKEIRAIGRKAKASNSEGKTQVNLNDEEKYTAEDDDEGWASETSEFQDDNSTAETGTTKKVHSRTSRMVTGHPHHAHGHKKRRSLSRRGHNLPGVTVGEGEIVEEMRGRDNRPSSSRSLGNVVTFASSSTGKSGHHSQQAYSKTSRPGTADTYLSRTSVGSGTGEGSLRNHRLESLRALHSVPPTRESSPSRSVRFVQSHEGTGLGSKKSTIGVDTFESSKTTGTISTRGSPLASAQASRSPSPTPAEPK